MPKVAVLHTSFVFVTVEPVITDLLNELTPGAEILHFVDSDVLATVVREQGISAGARSGWSCSHAPRRLSPRT